MISSLKGIPVKSCPHDYKYQIWWLLFVLEEQDSSQKNNVIVDIMVPPNSNGSEIAKGFPYVGHPAAPSVVTVAFDSDRWKWGN